MDDDALIEPMLLDESSEPKNLPVSLLKTITKDFSDDLRIGSGGFAEVYKGLLGNGTIAVKRLFNRLEVDEKKFKQEVDCLRKVKHRNIVRFLGYCDDIQKQMAEYKGKLVEADVPQRLLCFEYLSKGSLDSYITDASRGLEWRERYQIIKGICEGLHYLHENRIVHSDLKPANILLDDNMEPKIADFGLSRFLEENQSHVIATKLVGSLGYLPPEFFSGVITFKSDIYSLGVIITEILTGQKGYSPVDKVLGSWRNRSETRVGILKQLRVCAEIGIDCMNLDPAKRPVTRRMIEMLSKTETTMNTLSVPQVGMYLTEIWQGFKRIAPFSIQQVHNNVLRNFLVDLLLDSSVKATKLPFTLLKEITKNFSSDQEIGRGEFGTVYKGELGNGMLIAVKRFHARCVIEEQTFQGKANCLTRVKHKNIVRCLGHSVHTYEHLQNGIDKIGVQERLLCFEYLHNGSLDSYITDKSQGLDWPTCYQIIKGICSGLNYLHQSERIVHLDLKPANILLDNSMTPKITDFGISKIFSKKKTYILSTNQTRALKYMAPEYITDGIISIKADIYSLGVIITELLSTGGCKDSVDEVLQNWKRRFDTSMEICFEQVKGCLEIAEKCMQVNRFERPTTWEIIDMLNAIDYMNPFLTLQGFLTLARDADGSPVGQELAEKHYGEFD